MPYDFLAACVFMRVEWPARRESPVEVAARFRRFLDDLASIDASLKTWSVGRKLDVPYASVRDNLIALVHKDVMRDELGKDEVKAGYDIGAISHDRRQMFSFGGNAGSVYKGFLSNRIYFSTSGGRAPDPTIVNYRLVKAVTLAAIAAWEPLFCLTGSSELEPTPEDGRYFKAWITYVPPEDVASLDLVGVPFAERTPDGGMLLSATEDVFDGANPTHVEGARRIQIAMKPLNAKLP